MFTIKSTLDHESIPDDKNITLEKFKEKLKDDNNFQSIIFLALLLPFFVVFVFVSQGFNIGSNILVNGVINGTSLALLALGFSIIFGVARMFKLSLGGYFVLGAYTAFWFTRASVLNFNDIVDRPLIVDGSFDFTLLNLRLIHAFPFAIFITGIIYIARNVDRVKGVFFIGLNISFYYIERFVMVSEFGKAKEQATFQTMLIVSSVVLISLGLKYFELSNLQIMASATSLHLFMLAMNYSGISNSSPALYFAIMIYAIVFVAIVSMLVDRYLLNKIRASPTNVLIITFAIALFIQSIIAELSFPLDFDQTSSGFEKFGIQARGFNGLVPKGENIDILGENYQALRVVAMIGAITLIVLTLLFINFSTMGLAMKAVSQDEDAAWLVGINVNKVYLIATGLGMGLAAAAGVLISPYEARPFWGIFMGWPVLVLAIAVVTVGGLGSVIGSVVAGFIIGFAQAYISQTNSSQTLIVPFIVILITMLFRPSGLFGIEEEQE